MLAEDSTNHASIMSENVSQMDNSKKKRVMSHNLPHSPDFKLDSNGNLPVFGHIHKNEMDNNE